MKIKEIVELKNFKTIVNLQWANSPNHSKELLEKYIITEDLAELYGEILETINGMRFEEKRSRMGDLSDYLRSHIISGQYGTGKSYFLLVLSMILELDNEKNLDIISNKFKDFPELNYQLEQLKKSKKNLVVRISGQNENEKKFINLIQDSINDKLHKKFDNVTLKTNYQTLIDNLKDHRNDKKRWEILKEGLATKNYSYEDLLAGLKAYKEEFKTKYLSLMDEVKLDAGNNLKNLENYLKDVDSFLKSNDYGNLIIIFDEFSLYLDTSIESKRINTDLASIQDLAELTEPTSGYNIAFISSTHVDMGDLLNKALSDEKSIEKVLRRFNQNIIAFEQGNELIKNTIKINSQKFGDLKQEFLQDFLSLERTYNILMEDFYPLHPATLTYLKPVADRFAQAESTLFTFLKEVIQEKYYNQEAIINNKLNLVQPDEIFDYFIEPLKKKELNLIEAYNQLMGISNKNIHKKISKLLVVSRASLLSREGAGLSLNDFKNAFLIKKDEDYIKNTIKELEEDSRSPIIYSEGKYELIPGGQTIDIEKKLQNKAQSINPYSVLKNILFDFSDIIEIKKYYNISYKKGIFPLDRELEGKFVSVAELTNKKIKRHLNINKEGKIIFLIPKFNESYNLEKLKVEYSKQMKEAPENAVLAFPKKVYFQKKDLKLYGAIKDLETDQDILSNENLKKLFMNRKRKLENNVKQTQLRNFGKINNFIFIYGGSKVVENYESNSEFFRDLLYNYYHRFPYEIKTENVNDRSSSNKLIERLIITGDEIISKDSNSVFQKHVFNTLEPLDLIKKENQPNNYKIKIKAPEKENNEKSYEIWTIINSDKINLNEKFNRLTSAPYGLNEPIIEIYIALSIGLGKYRLRDNDRRVIKKPGKTHISNIRNSNYELEKVTDTSTAKKEKVKAIWEIFSMLITNSQYRDYEPHGAWRDLEVFAVLGEEMSQLKNNLHNYITSFKNLKLNFSIIDNIESEIKKSLSSDSPEQLYNNLINISNKIFNQENFDSNLKKLEDVIMNMRKIKEEKYNKINEINKKVSALELKIETLNNFDNLKSDLVELNKLLNKYRKNPFIFKLIEELEFKKSSLIAQYNQIYKKKHDEYNSIIAQVKNEIMKNEMLEIAKVLENLSFDEIKDTNEVIIDLKNFHKCDDLIIDDSNIAECLCSKSSLREVEKKYETKENLIKRYQKEIYNIFLRYKEILNENAQDIDSFIQDKHNKELLNKWKFIYKSINSDPKKHKEQLIKNINDIYEFINLYIEKGEDSINFDNLISLNLFVEKIEENIKTYGLEQLTFEKLDKIYNETRKELIQEYDGLSF